MTETYFTTTSVSAKIISHPEFKIPDIQAEDVIFSSVGSVNQIITEFVTSLPTNQNITKTVKLISGATSDVALTAIDISMSYKTEGIVQATITATAASGLTVLAGVGLTIGLGSAATTTSGILLLSIASGVINLSLGKLFD